MYLCGDALISFQCFVLQSSALSVIQQDWFKVASGQQASFKEVDGYMACFEDFSTELLEHVVNMTDGNVCITNNNATKQRYMVQLQRENNLFSFDLQS